MSCMILPKSTIVTIALGLVAGQHVENGTTTVFTQLCEKHGFGRLACPNALLLANNLAFRERYSDHEFSVDRSRFDQDALHTNWQSMLLMVQDLEYQLGEFAENDHSNEALFVQAILKALRAYQGALVAHNSGKSLAKLNASRTEHLLAKACRRFQAAKLA